MSADEDVYLRQGFGASVGMGARPGLLVIDFTNGFADPAGFGGGNIAAAIARTQTLLAFARARRWPVAHSRIVFQGDGADANPFSRKIPGMLILTEDNPASHFVPALQPAAGELVVRKTVPSAFFGTALAPWLMQCGVDTLVVAGCTTSGCVRASVVDAMSAGLRVIVAADCVGDRATGPHEASLFDMQQKYADVMPFEAIRQLAEARSAEG